MSNLIKLKNIKHSSAKDDWQTPKWLIDRVKLVLGEIDLDPASDISANKTINAKRIITKEEDGLISSWGDKKINVFCNPPGNKIEGKSSTVLFWQKLMNFRADGFLKQAIFLAFSIEALQTTQNKTYSGKKGDLGCPSIGNFGICIPQKRINFIDSNGEEGTAPSHASVICYVSDYSYKYNFDDYYKFVDIFRDVGVCMRGEF